MRSSAVSVVLAGVAVLGGTAGADVVTLAASQDNTLFQDPTGSLSNGSGTAMFAGKTSRGEIRRGLIEFNLQSMVPSNAVITRAELTLYCDRAHGATVSMGLHAVSSSWGEGASFTGLGAGAPAERGDATWTTRFYGIGPSWVTLGGDFTAPASAVLNVSGAGRAYTWSGAGLVADLQRWLSAPDTNNGWLLKAESETASGTAKRFVSREGDPVAREPRLLIEYTVVPAPGVLGVLAAGGLLASRRRR